MPPCKELAFFSWFFNPNSTPSLGAGGKFSSQGTLTDLPGIARPVELSGCKLLHLRTLAGKNARNASILLDQANRLISLVVRPSLSVTLTRRAVPELAGLRCGNDSPEGEPQRKVHMSRVIRRCPTDISTAW